MATSLPNDLRSQANGLGQYTPRTEAEMILDAVRDGGVSGAGNGEGLTAYEGLVASRGLVPCGRSATAKQGQTRSVHFARDAISAIQLMYGNFFVSTFSTVPSITGGAETGAGAASTWAAAVEYPAGTFTRITFGGASSGVSPDGGTVLSDKVTLPVTIPLGAKFWIRTYVTTTGLLCHYTHTGATGMDTALGEGGEFAASGITDRTMGGAIASTASTNIYPIAIIGTTSRPSILTFGDSRDLGVLDAFGVAGNIGNIARSIGTRYAYTVSASGGDRLSWFATQYTQRMKLVPYASHIIVQQGINDLNNAFTGANLIAQGQIVWAAIAAVKQAQAKVFHTTLEPWTTSSDSWATTTNQAALAWAAERVNFNSALRNTIQTNLYGVIDIADAMESSRNSGLWRVTGVANAITSDGIHAVQYGNELIAEANAVKTGTGLS